MIFDESLGKIVAISSNLVPGLGTGELPPEISAEAAQTFASFHFEEVYGTPVDEVSDAELLYVPVKLDGDKFEKPVLGWRVQVSSPYLDANDLPQIRSFVVRADAEGDGRFGLFWLESISGSVFRITPELPPGGTVQFFTVDPSGTQAALTADLLGTGRFRLYRASIFGGPPIPRGGDPGPDPSQKLFAPGRFSRSPDTVPGPGSCPRNGYCRCGARRYRYMQHRSDANPAIQDRTGH